MVRYILLSRFQKDEFEAISHFCQQNLRLQMEMCFRIDFAHCTRPVDVIKLLFLQQMMQPAVHRSWELLNARNNLKVISSDLI